MSIPPLVGPLLLSDLLTRLIIVEDVPTHAAEFLRSEQRIMLFTPSHFSDVAIVFLAKVMMAFLKLFRLVFFHLLLSNVLNLVLDFYTDFDL